MLAQASRQDPDSVIVPRRCITVVMLRPQFPKPNSSDNVVAFFVVFLIQKIPLANSCRLSQTQPHCLTLDLPCYSCHGWCSSWVFIEGTDICRLLTLTSWHLLTSLDLVIFSECEQLSRSSSFTTSHRTSQRCRCASDPFDPFDPWVRSTGAGTCHRHLIITNLPVRQRTNGWAKAPWPQLDSHKRARCVCLLLSRPEMIWDDLQTSVETNSGWNLQSLHSCFC